MHSCAIVVPVYQPVTDPFEQLSLAQTIKTLVAYPVYIVGPDKLQGYFEELVTDASGRIRYKTFKDHFFQSIDGYNDLLLSQCFYQAFDAFEYMLLVQTDALVLSSDLESWCAKQYSYVGAPWYEGYTRPTLPLTLTSVGNGGFSLRRVPDFIRVLSRPRLFKNVLMQSWPGGLISTVYRYLKDYHCVAFGNAHFNIKVNEDLFWGLFVSQQCKFFSVPSPAEALSFAFEAHPDHSYRLNNYTLPFGCHAWRRYQSEFWYKTLNDEGLEIGRLLQDLKLKE